METELTPDAWTQLLALRQRLGSAPRPGDRPAATAAPPPAAASGLPGLYRELILAAAAGPFTLAQLGQSLDGRIATLAGHPQAINGSAGLDHLHRLRALSDAVVVGATTVALDNPRLTTRRVAGANPTRVIIDPRGRLAAAARVFDGEAPSLVITRGDAGGPPHPAAGRGIPVIGLAAGADGRLPPAAILAALHARGLTRVLIEGGADTISAFLAAGCIDRLQVTVAPLLIGSGTAALRLPPVTAIDHAIRLRMTVVPLGGDVLFDCRPGEEPRAG